MSGKETLMLFSSDHYASLTPDNKRLRRFKKIFLDAGASKEVKFLLPVMELAFVNQFNETLVEPGKFDLIINDEKVEIKVD